MMDTSSIFKPNNKVGPDGAYELLKPVSRDRPSGEPSVRMRQSLDLAQMRNMSWSGERWRARSEMNELVQVRVVRAPLPAHCTADRIAREQRTLLREADRWRGVHIARPEVIELFFEDGFLCWVERPIRGAALSSLQEPLHYTEGLNLLEEALYAIDQLHSERDFKSGDPLLHLNINAETIWRGVNGGLYLMDPVTTSWATLFGQTFPRGVEDLRGIEAPELEAGQD